MEARVDTVPQTVTPPRAEGLEFAGTPPLERLGVRERMERSCSSGPSGTAAAC